MGIRRKVTIGFATLAVLVMAAGAVSIFELKKIGEETRRITEENDHNLAISKELIEGARMLNLALVQIDTMRLATPAGDSLYAAGRQVLDNVLAKEREERVLGVHTGELRHMVYRAITPSLVTLGTVIVLLVLLLYFIDTYYMKPVVGMNRALKEWLTSNIPFRVTVEGRDEAGELNENISELTGRHKK